MDPIGASSCNLNANHLVNNKQQIVDKYFQILGSHTSLTRYEKRNFRAFLPQLSASVIAASYYIIVGVTLAYSAIFLPQMKEHPEFPLSETQGSWIASIVPLTVPIGTILSGFLADKYGRLNTLKMAAIPSIIGYTLIALCQSFWWMMVGRIFTAFSIALGSGPPIVYITEIARSDMRGSLISLNATLASFGMALTFLKGWLMTWRSVAWVAVIYTIIPFLLVFFIPESPLWLISKGRQQDAKKSLNWLNSGQPKENFTDLQLALLQKEHDLKMLEGNKTQHNENANVDEGKRSSILREFLKPTGYKPMLILIGMFFFQQFSGIFIFLFYSISFFQEVGTTFNPYIASIGIGLVRVVMSLTNMYLLSHFRRRPMMFLSHFSMGLSIFLSGLFTQLNQSGITNQTWIPTVCLLLFVLTSMIGIIPIPFTMSAELFPLEIRGVATSFAFAIANFFMFLTIQTFPFVKHLFGGIIGAQYYFAAMLALGSIFMWIFLPETFNTKLKDIEEYFKEHTVYLLRKPANHSPKLPINI